METRASYVLIGAFALGILIATFGFVLWLGKVSLEREWVYYDIVFEEAVTGLTTGGAVQYSGIQVGEVRKLSLAPSDPRRVIAHVRLNADTPVKTDTRARLTLVGLTGVTIIQLSGGSPSAAALLPGPGESVAHITAETSAMQSLLASGQDMALSANDALQRVGKVLSDDNLAHVSAALRNMDEVTAALAAQRNDLRHLSADLTVASGRLSTTLARLDRLATSADSVLNKQAVPLMESAQTWIATATRTTDSANAILAGNREPIARFTTDGLGQLGPALSELRATLRALRITAGRAQDDPAAYLLGRDKPKEFKPK